MRKPPIRGFFYCAVVGSIIVATADMLLAGKPPIAACFLTVASSGAI